MSIKQLVLRLCKLEGKKEQVNVAQMHEVVGYLSDLYVKYPEISDLLILNGHKRKNK